MVAITFNDLGVRGHLAMDVHYPNGTLQERILTNGSVTLNESLGDFTIIVHPKESTMMGDPLGLVTLLNYYGDSLLGYGMVFGIIIFCAWLFKRFTK